MCKLNLIYLSIILDARVASSPPLTQAWPLFYLLYGRHTSSLPPSAYSTNNIICLCYLLLLLNTLIIIQSLQEKRLCSQFVMPCIFLIIINVPAATPLDPYVRSLVVIKQVQTDKFNQHKWTNMWLLEHWNIRVILPC